ncbi:hypothetical protein N9R09_01360 [Porticoccaceae bacterium]|nr:hypothetical protein [Porticoccaceae bacterium]
MSASNGATIRTQARCQAAIPIDSYCGYRWRRCTADALGGRALKGVRRSQIIEECSMAIDRRKRVAVAALTILP